MRQKILVLYLDNSALDSEVRGWSSYDGASEEPPVSGGESAPPYKTGLAALRDGWRLIQMSELTPQATELAYEPSYMAFEAIFEKIVKVSP